MSPYRREETKETPEQQNNGSIYILYHMDSNNDHLITAPETQEVEEPEVIIISDSEDKPVKTTVKNPPEYYVR
jgi:hypothetical protein